MSLSSTDVYSDFVTFVPPQRLYALPSVGVDALLLPASTLAALPGSAFTARETTAAAADEHGNVDLSQLIALPELRQVSDRNYKTKIW